jgi:ankyrin repeat protein
MANNSYSSQKYPLLTTFWKEFPGFGVFQGTITKYYPIGLYRIHYYADGDEETLLEADIDQLMKQQHKLLQTPSTADAKKKKTQSSEGAILKKMSTSNKLDVKDATADLMMKDVAKLTLRQLFEKACETKNGKKHEINNQTSFQFDPEQISILSWIVQRVDNEYRESIRERWIFGPSFPPRNDPDSRLGKLRVILGDVTGIKVRVRNRVRVNNYHDDGTRGMEKQLRYIERVYKSRIGWSPLHHIAHDLGRGANWDDLGGIANWDDLARLLLSSGMDPNSRDKEGRTPLQLAISRLYESEFCIYSKHQVPLLCHQFIRMLLENGADVNAKDAQGRTPLHVLQKRNRNEEIEKIVQLLLQAGADIKATDSRGQTPLHGVKQKRVAEMLLRAGSDVNAKDLQGNTPLHVVMNGKRQDRQSVEDRQSVAEVLLQGGANRNAKNGNGRTPPLQVDFHDKSDDERLPRLHLGLRDKWWWCPKTILNVYCEDKAAATIKSTREGRYPLHFAFLEFLENIDGSDETSVIIVRSLVKRHPWALQQRDVAGFTPFHLFFEYGNSSNPRAVDLAHCICKRASQSAPSAFSIRDPLGQTPLQIAIAYDWPVDVIQDLVQRQLALPIPADGKSLLQIALEADDLVLVREIICCDFNYALDFLLWVLAKG